MVIVMNGHATEDQIEKVIAALTQKGYDAPPVDRPRGR